MLQPRGQKPDRCANLPARPPNPNPRCRRLSSASHRLSGAFPVRSCVAAAPSGVSQLRLSAAGEGAFTVTPQHPQPQNRKKQNFPPRKIANQAKSTAYSKTKSKQPSRPPAPPPAANTPEHPQPNRRPRRKQLTHRLSALTHRAAMRNRNSTDGNQRIRVFLSLEISRGSRKAAGTGPRSKRGAAKCGASKKTGTVRLRPASADPAPLPDRHAFQQPPYEDEAADCNRQACSEPR